MLTTIETLFDQIRKIAKHKNQTDVSFDGKKFWQPIKIILSDSTWKATKWKKQSKTKYEEIMNMPEFFINGYGNNIKIPENHFLIQTVRIPTNEEPSLKKICQIALNIGQYQGYTKKTIKNYSQAIRKISNDLVKLNLAFSTLEEISEKSDLKKLKDHYFAIDEFKQLDVRGKGMYSAGFNRLIEYQDFLKKQMHKEK